MIVNNPNISKEELNALKEAIADITVLIAGADGKIDKSEVSWGEKITKIRSYSLPANLNQFYKEVGISYASNLDSLITSLPEEVDKRTEMLENKLELLNPILAKLDNNEGAELYYSFLSFAKHVAKASGGFLGFFSVSYEESKFMNLPMLTPIEYEEEA